MAEEFFEKHLGRTTPPGPDGSMVGAWQKPDPDVALVNEIDRLRSWLRFIQDHTSDGMARALIKRALNSKAKMP